MTLEAATYIADFNTANPTGATAKSEMDDHLRLLKSVLKNSFTGITGAVTMTHTELNTVTARGLIAGQAWTGTHTFPATTYGVTAAFGSSGTGLATIDYVNAVATNAALPGQTGNAGKFLGTDGTTATWQALAFQAGATAAEIKTGASATKPIAPSTLLAAVGFSAYVQTADQVITSAGALTIAHGLGRAPVVLLGFLKNITGELSYVTGDIAPTAIGATLAAVNSGVGITADATNIYIRYGSAVGAFGVVNKTTGELSSITNANWSFFVRVLA